MSHTNYLKPLPSVSLNPYMVVPQMKPLPRNLQRKLKHLVMSGNENNYQIIFGKLKEKIRLTRQKASIAVNHELLQVYWEISHFILQQQKEESCGKKVISRLKAYQRSKS